MGLRINQNIAAMNAYRNLSVTDGQMSKSLEKLSSGYRINRAADDAAGLSISEGLRAQVGGLKVAVRNAQDGISVVQTAEGALTEVHAILQRMRDLAVQASNGGAQDSKAQEAANTEFGELKKELDRIGSTTKYGTTALLNGTPASKSGAVTTTGGNLVVTTGTNDAFTLAGTFGGVAVSEAVAVAQNTYTSASAYQTAMQTAIDNALTTDGASAGSVEARVSDVGGGVWKVELVSSKTASGAGFTIAASPTAAGVTAGASSNNSAYSGTFHIGANNDAGDSMNITFDGVNQTALGLTSTVVTSTTAAKAAITTLDTAIQTVSTTRAKLGAYQNRFEHTINNLNVAVENLSASESRIRDTDMAQEMVQFTRSQILSQAGTSMLAQANQVPQSVLSLLR
jgi:flagellin